VLNRYTGKKLFRKISTLFKLENKNILIFAYSQILILFVYKNSYVNNFGDHYHLILDIFRRNEVIYDAHPESPLFTIIGLIFSFQNFYIYGLLVYFVSSLLIFQIFKNLNFLEGNLIYLLLHGWLITISWWMGYVDIFTIFFSSILIKLSRTNDISLSKIFIVCTIMSFNHFGLGIIMLSIVFLLFYKLSFKLISRSFLGIVFGSILNSLYLVLIKYDFKDTRIGYVQNIDIVISNALSTLNNIGFVINSGFYIFSLIIAYLIVTKKIRINSFIIFGLLIAVLGSSILYDTSRYFSILSLPVVIKLIEINKDTLLKIKYKEFLILFSIFWPPTHLWEDRLYNISPFINDVSIFTLLNDIFNYFFKSILI